MANTKYTTYLSARSMKHTAKLIRNYQKRLSSKVEQFCDELAKIGETVIRADIATHTKGTKETIGSIKILKKGNGKDYYKAYVQVSSDAILFIEFGSGINHSMIRAPHENALETPMGPGTFGQAKPQNPLYENWANPDGWHYYDAAGKLHWSDGMTPTYPMYKGGKAMEEKIEEIARKVFG